MHYRVSKHQLVVCINKWRVECPVLKAKQRSQSVLNITCISFRREGKIWSHLSGLRDYEQMIGEGLTSFVQNTWQADENGGGRAVDSEWALRKKNKKRFTFLNVWPTFPPRPPLSVHVWCRGGAISITRWPDRGPASVFSAAFQPVLHWLRT